MKLRTLVRPRTVVLSALWLLPTLFYVVIAIYALWQTGWLASAAIVLGLCYAVSIAVAWGWPKTSQAAAAAEQPLAAAEYWTPLDRGAVGKVEEFRRSVADIDRVQFTDPQRYLADAQRMAGVIADHYHAAEKSHSLQPLTLVEIAAAIHLAVEDLEQWIVTSLPLSKMMKVGTIENLPNYADQFDKAYRLYYIASALLFHPTRMLYYPLWSKTANVAMQLQEEAVLTLYQKYLQLIGFYLIELYSGRLRGGSRQYKQHFHRFAALAHASDGDLSWLDQQQAVETKIAVMGQVKAGKSSLINALTQTDTAATNILPETRRIQRVQLQIPGSTQSVYLLDTPGYSEADAEGEKADAIDRAAEQADIILLVLAANSPAKEADRRMLEQLHRYYDRKPNLQMPVVIGVLTHIDLLAPVRQWEPPYEWRAPDTPKAESIADAVDYCREVFGSAVADYACVYTGEQKPDTRAVAEELIPVLVPYLAAGQSASLLKLYYKQLSERRTRQIIRQAANFAATVGRKLME